MRGGHLTRGPYIQASLHIFSLLFNATIEYVLLHQLQSNTLSIQLGWQVAVYQSKMSAQTIPQVIVHVAHVGSRSEHKIHMADCPTQTNTYKHS